MQLQRHHHTIALPCNTVYMHWDIALTIFLLHVLYYMTNFFVRPKPQVFQSSRYQNSRFIIFVNDSQIDVYNQCFPGLPLGFMQSYLFIRCMDCTNRFLLVIRSSFPLSKQSYKMLIFWFAWFYIWCPNLSQSISKDVRTLIPPQNLPNTKV